jgi:phenylacetate-CoA ligase
MLRVRGRTDDMLVVRGENVFPSQLEAILLEVEGLTANYHLVVDRQAARLDALEIRIEAAEGVDPTGLAELAGRRVRETIGLGVQVEVVLPGTLPRSEGKARRVVDRRAT